MIGNSAKGWNPFYLGLDYGFDANISQTKRISDMSTNLSIGSNNTYQSSGHSYYLDLENSTSQNYLFGGFSSSNFTRISISICLMWEFDGSLATTYLGGNGNGTSADSFRFYYDNSTNELICYIYEATGSLSETAKCSWTPSLNTRYTLVVTYDTTDINIYIDGVSQTITYSNKTNFNTYMAGATMTGQYGFLFVNGGAGTIGAEGKLFNALLFKRVLSQDDIDRLVNFNNMK